MTHLDTLAQEVLERLQSCLDIDETGSDMEEARREIAYGLVRAVQAPGIKITEATWREDMRGDAE